MLSGTDVPAHYFLEANAILGLEDGDAVATGDVIARIPQEGSKPVILPVVCHGSPICSRRESRKKRLF